MGELTRADIEAIAALEKAATPGEWGFRGPFERSNEYCLITYGEPDYSVGCDGTEPLTSAGYHYDPKTHEMYSDYGVLFEHDAALIPTLRNAAPALFAGYLRMLEAEGLLEEAEGLLRWYRDGSQTEGADRIAAFLAEGRNG